jgi:outer membrane protein assembly factor BamB
VTYYYAAFVHRSALPSVSPGRFCTGRPLDTAGPVKWAFSTGATALSPPTVGGAGVIAPSNDRVLYAMERSAAGGVWPGAWKPIELGDVVQSRSPVIPIPVGTANPVAYLGSQDGSIYAVDAAKGSQVWATPIGPMVQAAPARIFKAFSAFDYLLVGTRDGTGPNAFVALNPLNGLEIERYANGGAGAGRSGS